MKPQIIYGPGGVRYLTSGLVAKLLGVNQRTVLRWVERAGKPKAPQLLKTLVVHQDPISGFTYFREDAVLALKQELMTSRPIRVKR